MGLLRYLAVAASVALGVGAAGCRYQSMNTMGRVSAAPFEQLDCDEPGNGEGFSFMIPACECDAGIRMRYRASYQDDSSMLIRLEYEAGVNSEGTSDDTLVVLGMDGSVESVSYGGRQLTQSEESSPSDRYLWDSASGSARMMWDNYMPLFDMMMTTCIEDRIEAESERMGR
ncbi:hypothetical protein JW898_00015 [Candidatus Woesearchaeota archaeon]|nr:hypothetical protein [Candidatus Woesearchaeota archaeon]